METVPGKELLAPPVTYEDWLNCFELLKAGTSVDPGVLMTITKGSLINSGYITIKFNQKLAETINDMLNKRISRFLKELNMLISCNELSDIVPLFVKFRNEIRRCMFFTEFDFIERNIKKELEQSTRTQMERFWCDTVAFLQKQKIEYSNSHLEDSLLLIRRIELFERSV